MDFKGNTGEGVGKSAYNEALAQTMRISNALNVCGELSKSGKFDSWRYELDNIYKELFIHRSKLDNFKIDYSKVNKLVAIAFKVGNRSLMYKFLTDKELLLRELQDAAGLGGKYQDEDDSEDW